MSSYNRAIVSQNTWHPIACPTRWCIVWLQKCGVYSKFVKAPKIHVTLDLSITTPKSIWWRKTIKQLGGFFSSKYIYLSILFPTNVMFLYETLEIQLIFSMYPMHFSLFMGCCNKEMRKLHISKIPLQRPVTRSFDVFVDLRLNKCLSKH